MIALCVLSSCEKVRNLMPKSEAKPPPAAVSMGAWVSEIPEGAYDTFPLQSGKVVVVDFYADWCGPCRRLAPILDRIATEHGGSVVIGKVNIDKFSQLASQEKVRSIPDVRIYRDGKRVDQFIGLPEESEIRRRIEGHLEGLPALAAEESVKPKPTEPLTQPMSKDWMPPGVKRR